MNVVKRKIYFCRFFSRKLSTIALVSSVALFDYVRDCRNFTAQVVNSCSFLYTAYAFHMSLFFRAIRSQL